MQVLQDKLSLLEAEERMQTYFGSNVEIWNLHGVILQVPPSLPDLHEGEVWSWQGIEC